MIRVEVLYSASAIGTQILLSHRDQHFLVDIGDGAVRDLAERKVDFEDIKAIFLTHEHFDHFSGLYEFLHFSRLLRRKEELVLVVPQPTRVVSHLLNPPIMYETLPYPVRLLELSDRESASVGPLNATAFSVKHGSANAFGYSIQDPEGFRVVVSGDTTVCANLERNVAGADVALIEATYDDTCGELASKYGHMTRSQAENLGKRAKKAIYIHSNPSHYFKKFECSQQ
jgi:ribonuclease BN (tRNA processing enzyme)